MQIHNLKRKHKNKRSVAVGRGGKRGKTSGRGTKGQNARAGRKKRPEMRDIIKRLPKLRGRGVSSLKSLQSKFFPVNISRIETLFSSGDTVSPKTLAQKGVIKSFSGELPKVKILGTGEITKKVIISSCAVSASARTKIEAVGGSVK